MSAIAIGLLAALATWAVTGLCARPMTSAEAAQPRLYAELRSRQKLLSDRLPPPTALPANVPDGAHQEVVDLLADAASELRPPLGDPGLRWAIGHGYTNVLRTLHRASEILILLETEEAVIGDALDDELSLEESTIDNRDRLGSILRAAVHRLSPGAAAAFLATAPGAAPPVLSAMEARQATREVHHAITGFRDGRRDSLIRARNNLMWTTLAVALPAYLLLGLAMLVEVDRVQVVTASTFFLVGAIVGLFQRLDAQSARDTATEDFGLYQARLISAPLLSGVAAVAGVFLVSALPSVAAGTTDTVESALWSAFDIREEPIGLLFAAVFGLTPALLTTQLDKQSSKLVNDLTTSVPATNTSP